MGTCTLVLMHLTCGHYARSWEYHILATCQMRNSEELPLSHLFTNRRLWLFGLIARSSHRKHHRRALAAAIQVPPDWKRSKGRPSHTWLRAIEADLGLLNIDLATAWRKATIRDDWKKKKQKKKDSSAAWSLWWVGRSSLMTHSRGFLGDFRGQTQLRVENGLKWSYVVLELEC